MTSLNFYAVASRHAEWASARRTVVAANIANANTPGYKAKDVEAFSNEMSSRGAGMQATHMAHFGAGGGAGNLVATRLDGAAQDYHSGNSVSLDHEMMKAGSVSREQNLNAGLMKAFNRLVSLSTRG